MGIIQITQEEYDELVEASMKLSALEKFGVDCWEGYDEAMDDFREWLASKGDEE